MKIIFLIIFFWFTASPALKIHFQLFWYCLELFSINHTFFQANLRKKIFQIFFLILEKKIVINFFRFSAFSALKIFFELFSNFSRFFGTNFTFFSDKLEKKFFFLFFLNKNFYFFIFSNFQMASRGRVCCLGLSSTLAIFSLILLTVCMFSASFRYNSDSLGGVKNYGLFRFCYTPESQSQSRDGTVHMGYCRDTVQ